MAKNREVKSRIKAIQNIQKVTRSMKLISTIKLKQVATYLHGLDLVIDQSKRNIGRLLHELYFTPDLRATLSPFTRKACNDEPTGETVILVAISADKGLCGPFNSQLAKAVSYRIASLKDQGKKVKLVTFGRKVMNYLTKNHPESELALSQVALSLLPEAALVGRCVSELQDLYLDHAVCSVEFIFNKYLSASRSDLTIETVLPLPKAIALEGKSDYGAVIIEPSFAGALEVAVRQQLFAQLQNVLVSSRASELAMRVNAMSAASDNAKDLISRLTVSFNKARQAAITQEISEIVAGSEV